MKASAWLVVAPTMLMLVACGGQVVQNQPLNEIDPTTLDGAFVSYFLPRGLFTVTATYESKKDALTLAYGVKIIPDVRKRHQAVYRHSEMSIDDVTIAVDANGLLQQISTTTEDQTLAVVKAAGEVIKQVGEFQKAVEKPKGLVAPEAAQPPQAACAADTTIVVQATTDLTYGPDSRFDQKELSERSSGGCTLRVALKVHET